MNGILREMYQPILLGDGIGLFRELAALRHSACAVPLALTLRPHPFLSALFRVRIRRLAREELPFLSDLLVSVAEAEEDKILCLIPTTDAFRRFTEESRRVLEPYFLLVRGKDSVGGDNFRVFAEGGQE